MIWLVSDELIDIPNGNKIAKNGADYIYSDGTPRNIYSWVDYIKNDTNGFEINLDNNKEFATIENNTNGIIIFNPLADALGFDIILSPSERTAIAWGNRRLLFSGFDDRVPIETDGKIIHKNGSKGYVTVDGRTFRQKIPFINKVYSMTTEILTNNQVGFFIDFFNHLGSNQNLTFHGGVPDIFDSNKTTNYQATLQEDLKQSDGVNFSSQQWILTDRN